MLFAAAWMELEIIILSEENQTEKNNTTQYHLYVESLKITQINFFTKQTHRYRKQMYGYYKRKEGGGKIRSSGLTDIHYYI